MVDLTVEIKDLQIFHLLFHTFLYIHV